MRSPKLVATGTATISMTPMIDVVFLLIIFFLVSSHLVRQENLLPLELPKAETGLPELSATESIVINVLPDGGWLMHGNAVNERELEINLRRRMLATETPLQLRIRTDHSVPYAQLEPILGTAARLGIGDVVFSVFEER